MAKRIEYDPHALYRMHQRQFSHRDVETVLSTGLQSLAPTKAGREQRYQRVGKVRGWETRVVFLENDERILVISVMWVWPTPDQQQP